MPHFTLGKKEWELRPVSPECPLQLGQAVKYAKEMFSQISLIIRAQSLVSQHRQLAPCPATIRLLLRLHGMLQAESFCHPSKGRVSLMGAFQIAAAQGRGETMLGRISDSTSVEQDNSLRSQDKPRFPLQASWKHTA